MNRPREFDHGRRADRTRLRSASTGPPVLVRQIISCVPGLVADRAARDFDISPCLAIVKSTIETAFNYRFARRAVDRPPSSPPPSRKPGSRSSLSILCHHRGP
jgi:hypothetical protein